MKIYIYIYTNHQACNCNSQSANHNTTISRKNKNNFPWKQENQINKQTKALSERERERCKPVCCFLWDLDVKKRKRWKN